MSNNKQSSVEWLLKELEEIGVLNIKNCHWSDEVDIKKAIEQAKAMHKEEHKSTYIEGFTDGVPKFEKYYNETFTND